MWPMLGGLISAGSSLLGGILGQNNQQQINQQNIAAQEQINQQNIANQDMLNQQNIAEQEKFAQSGVQWKVADAKAAGINPLAALGAQTNSFSNNVGATAVAPTSSSSNSFGTGVAQAGQDISRAINATRSPEEQVIAAHKTSLDLESMELDNEIKRASLASSLARLTGAHSGPGIRPASTGVPDYQVMRDSSGQPTLQKSKESQAAGFDWIDDIIWQMKNRVTQGMGYRIPKELGPPAKGMDWYLDPDGVYRQYPGARRVLPPATIGGADPQLGTGL